MYVCLYIMYMSKLDHQPHEIFYVYIIIYTWFLLV